MYDDIASGYDELYREEQMEKMKIIGSNIKIRKNWKLLDVGCGTGISTNYFDCTSIGIDISEKMIKRGSGNLRAGDAEKLPFEDKTFDIVLCVSAIHNFRDFRRALDEMERVGKNLIVITVMKKARGFRTIKDEIERRFRVKEIDGVKDMIFICKKNIKP